MVHLNSDSQTLDTFLVDEKVENVNHTLKKKSKTDNRKLKTCVLFVSYISLGLDLSVLGIVLPTLSNNISTSISSTSIVLVVRGVGYLCGSAISGLLDRKVQDRNILFWSLLIKFFGLVFIPVSSLGLPFLFVSTTINAIGMGMLETIGNVHCLRLWGSKVDPYLQFLHFGFCIGAVLSPIIAEPFIDETNTTCVYNSTTLNISEQCLSTNSVLCQIKTIENTNIPMVSIVFIILSAFNIFVLFLLISSFCCYKDKIADKKAKPPAGKTLKFTNKLLKKEFIVLMVFFFFMYNGIEVSFISFIYIFATTEMEYDKQLASSLCLMFYISVICGQFASIFLSAKMSPKNIMIINVTGLFTSTIMLVLTPYYKSTMDWMFWLSIGLAGLSSTSLYANTFLWAKNYMDLNGILSQNRITSVFIIGASLGEITLPIPITQLITDQPVSFVYILGCYVIMIVFIVIALIAISRHSDVITGKIDSSDAKNGECKNNQVVLDDRNLTQNC